MNDSNSYDGPLLAKHYTHIYVEDGARDYPLTGEILSRFADAHVVPVADYKRVFNRSGQQFNVQKKSMKLILAVKRAPLTYTFPDPCQLGSFDRGIYVTPALGCLFDCDFCFLHGMLDSANIVLFVNTAEMEEAIAKVAGQNKDPLFASISYESDLLGLERISGVFSQWLGVASRLPEVKFECRTRHGSAGPLRNRPPLSNVLMSWSLAPRKLVDRYEHGTPSVATRLKAAAEAASLGWRLRVCLDPVLPCEDLGKAYEELLADLFARISPADIEDVTVGPFRMGKDFRKRAKKRRPGCDLYYMDPPVAAGEIRRYVVEPLQKILGQGKVLVWE